MGCSVPTVKETGRGSGKCGQFINESSCKEAVLTVTAFHSKIFICGARQYRSRLTEPLGLNNLGF